MSPRPIRFRGISMWQVQHGVRWRWRWVTDQSGEFQHPERSGRADELSARWQQNWPDVEPIGHLLRAAYPDRWVRFHSLPGSKRYAESPAEYAEILSRHRQVLGELQGGLVPQRLIAIGEDFAARDLATGWSRRSLPRPWPWRMVVEAEGEPPSYLWVNNGLSDDELDTLLIAVADDRSRVILSTADVSWLYHPYDGGADIIAPDAVVRDALRERHSDWLSTHPSGL